MEWMPGGGLDVVAPTVLRSIGSADKIGYACMANNALTIEAWVRPAAVNHAGPARVLTFADGATNANFMLGQDNTLSTVRLRTTETLAGSFSNWDVTHPSTIANEPNGELPWRGEIYLAAVYCRDLAPAEIWQNYEAGY